MPSNCVHKPILSQIVVRNSAGIHSLIIFFDLRKWTVNSMLSKGLICSGARQNLPQSFPELLAQSARQNFPIVLATGWKLWIQEIFCVLVIMTGNWPTCGKLPWCFLINRKFTSSSHLTSLFLSVKESNQLPYNNYHFILWTQVKESRF